MMLAENRALRVLLVATRYLPYIGGLETHVYEVGRRLASAGVDITILTTDLSGELPPTEEADGMHIHRVRAWPKNKDYHFAPDIYRFIMSGQWDLIHCQGYHTFVPPLAMFAAWRANIPYVLTFHSGGHSSRLRNMLRGLQWETLRPLLSRAKKLIAVAEFEAAFFQKHLRLPRDRFAVIPNGAHLPALTMPVEHTIPRSLNDGLVITSIGRLERYKGHHRVIEALPKVHEHIPDVRLRIVGAGPYEAALWKLAKKLEVSDYVEIRAVSTGNRSAMAALIAETDLMTLLSEYESQGIAVMEAIALKRPVLVASTSALQEFAEQGLVRSVSLDRGNDEVAKAIISQLSQPLIPADVALPTWDDCAAQILALYETITRRSLCVS
jgi:glycosyltransferase involved in cell wall biosynthesis